MMWHLKLNVYVWASSHLKYRLAHVTYQDTCLVHHTVSEFKSNAHDNGQIKYTWLTCCHELLFFSFKNVISISTTIYLATITPRLCLCNNVKRLLKITPPPPMSPLSDCRNEYRYNHSVLSKNIQCIHLGYHRIHITTESLKLHKIFSYVKITLIQLEQ